MKSGSLSLTFIGAGLIEPDEGGLYAVKYEICPPSTTISIVPDPVKHEFAKIPAPTTSIEPVPVTVIPPIDPQELDKEAIPFPKARVSLGNTLEVASTFVLSSSLPIIFAKVVSLVVDTVILMSRKVR
ncbi:MAG: hypothetical protein ACD_34C00641G0001 [uncultured bacterium]|nr:MAG: hypothetical protein ACD_34C00641G0001 [uncultured bacterium]